MILLLVVTAGGGAGVGGVEGEAALSLPPRQKARECDTIPPPSAHTVQA